MRVQSASRHVVGLGAGPLDFLSEIGMSIQNAIAQSKATAANQARQNARRQAVFNAYVSGQQPRPGRARAVTARRVSGVSASQLVGVAAPRRIGMGAVNLQDPTLTSAAQTLYTQLQSSGCPTSVDANVQAFQQAWTDAGGTLPADTGGRSPIDGLYGTNTANALQQIYSDALPGCVGALGSAGGAASTAVSAALGASNPISVYFADVLAGGYSFWGTLLVAGAIGAAVWSDHHQKGKTKRAMGKVSRRRPKKRPASRRPRRAKKTRRGPRRRR